MSKKYATQKFSEKTYNKWYNLAKKLEKENTLLKSKLAVLHPILVQASADTTRASLLLDA